MTVPRRDEGWQQTLAGSGSPIVTGGSPRQTPEAAIPEIEVTAVPACPVCGGNEFGTYAVGFDYELRTCRNPWRFVRCASCTHVWLNPRPALSTLPVIYPSTYYAYNYERIPWIARRGKQWLDAGKLSGIQARLGRTPQTYLDVGCGNGRFLRAMEKYAHLSPSSLYGLELDQAVTRSLSDEGYQVFCERVENCTGIADGSIDLATMFHVIEHVDDPASVVRKIAGWLTPGGILAIETPNIDSMDARLFRDRFWGGYHFPRHWNLFPLQPWPV